LLYTVCTNRKGAEGSRTGRERRGSVGKTRRAMPFQGTRKKGEEKEKELSRERASREEITTTKSPFTDRKGGKGKEKGEERKTAPQLSRYNPSA